MAADALVKLLEPLSAMPQTLLELLIAKVAEPVLRS